MISTKQHTQLLETFKTLSLCERQLLVLNIVFCEEMQQYGFENQLLAIAIHAGMLYEHNVPLKPSMYQDIKRKLIIQGFSCQKNLLKVHKGLHHEFLACMSAADLACVVAIIKTLSAEKTYVNITHNYHRYYLKQLVIISLYINDHDFFTQDSNNPIYFQTINEYIYETIAESPIEKSWLQSKHPIIKAFICVSLLGSYYYECQVTINNQAVLEVFQQDSNQELNHDLLHYYIAIIYLSLADIDSSKSHLNYIKDKLSGCYLLLQVTIALLTKQTSSLGSQYRKALTALRKQYEMRGYYIDNVMGIFHQISLAYIEKTPLKINTHLEQYNKYSRTNNALTMDVSYQILPIIIFIEQGEANTAQQHLLDCIDNTAEYTMYPMVMVIYYLLRFMISKDYINQNSEQVHKYILECIQQKQMLAAHIMYELLANIPKYQVQAQDFLEKSAIKLRLLELINVKDAWEYSFQALEELLLEEGSANSIIYTKAKRLLWLVDPEKLNVEVVEQTAGKSGWSIGKNISLHKLHQYNLYEQFNYLSNADKIALNGLVLHENIWEAYYTFDSYRTLNALVGHPNIAHAKNRSVAIQLVHAEPELHIEETKQGYKMSLSHYLTHAGVILEPESLNKYKVVDFSKAFVDIGQILTKKGLLIPAHAKEKVLRVIQHAKSDININVGIKDLIPEIPGDTTPYLQILPTTEGVRATLWVKPLINQGSYYKAGQGKDSIMTIVSDNGVETRTRIVRDLQLEKKNQSRLLAKCPELSAFEVEPCEYEINTPEETLEMLSAIQQLAINEDEAQSKPSLIIEWPQGQSFKIKQRIFSKGFAVNIASIDNWFEFGGTISLDDGEVIGMQELLHNINMQAYGRFIRLNNGEFIELTSKLKQQLSVLAAISDGNKINSLSAQVLSDIVADAENTTFDSGWEAHLKKLQTMKKHHPKVPSTLQATLRDYQIEGFQYLSRLAQWGIGACLADDMGLGKTVQTIALLLERAKKGPALIIAPTSVTFNWIEELNKFAPTLKVYDLRIDDRATLIDKATAFHIIIASYGLLQHNEELLSNKKWQTIVLDEAQAIKNANTQRWKSVMKLQADARIALSGTPIENHLGELWSIFSFINPGLLGNIRSFQTKYVTPIENTQSKEKIQALKALVSPYILRRMKSTVLKELPPKIEQTIHVEQSEAEATFYEALRRNAEERMNNFIKENNRIGVLTEITKLRQACCDSSLIDKSLNIENSKLKAFIETVKNIIDNGHKAIVFSQYVSFLAIVRQRIEAENIIYQYLDGTTSSVNRKKAVDAFQSGEGDIFLLSLKAGGSGLNLTAADYVIHLDPWWNPAVEDQASDRAHRLGQERPVTIYRFVMQNTIEEKIISLHEHKRHLASELLSGQGISGKLSNEDLMNLIHKSHKEASNK